MSWFKNFANNKADYSGFAESFNSETSKMDTGYSAWALSMGKIMHVDYERLLVTVAPLTGTNNELESRPIPIVFPGAGRRHFLGSLPEVGDFALLGHVSQNSGGQGGGKLPICIGWFTAPYWMGRDWIPTSDIDPSSGVLDTYEREVRFRGLVTRSRMKLRGLEPGHIVASSSQGADLVLDESVTLANRRGNQIILRDQDQAIVMRSLNEFHTLSGARVYSGMVQRDARLLPPELFADKTNWQTRKMLLLHEDNVDGSLPAGYLDPASIFQRNPGTFESEWKKEGNEPNLGANNPYSFLYYARLIDKKGFASTNRQARNQAIYGGKSFFRVGVDAKGEDNIVNSVVNSVLSTKDRSLTEHRIELSHTADGTLPVTEQTEGFDVDRIPSKGGKNPNLPFIEIVHGSVVGNDPYTDLSTYGVPLVPQLYEEGELAPALISGIGKPLGDHAAFLYRIRPLSGKPPTWIAINKRGKVMANLAGGIEFNTASDIVFGGKSVGFDSQNLTLKGRGSSKSAFGIELTSETGAIKLYGGGKSNEGLQTSRGEEGGSNERRQPSLHLEGKDNVLIKANTSVMIHASTLDLTKTKQIILNSQSDMELASGDKLSSTSGAIEQTSNKTFTQTANGGSPLDGPAYKLTIPTLPPTGAVGQPQRVIEQKLGGTEHKIDIGNHDTQIRVGKHTTKIQGAGEISNTVLEVNRTTLNNVGHSVNVGSGNISQLASGAVSTTGGGMVTSTAGGVNTLRGASVIIGAPGSSVAPGPLVTGGTRCPITGLPFSITTNCNTGVVTTP